MIYPIVAYGDPVLRKVTEEVNHEEIDVKVLSEDMFETMRNANGVGLAAPQIGKSIRLFIVDAAPMEDEKYEGFSAVFINPEIIEEDGEDRDFEEGCLSIPGYIGQVKRAVSVTIKGRDRNGKEIRIKANDLLAQVLEHEINHLNGVLYIDHLEGMDKPRKIEPEETPL